ncbi:avidin-like [Anneissia japonica]|uniref:avidin-like n=1 Tax=Anneissia japonica TaxID=1529436 RepID=UPI0014259390|nr:avidin-like [Anneissia japonica]
MNRVFLITIIITLIIGATLASAYQGVLTKLLRNKHKMEEKRLDKGEQLIHYSQCNLQGSWINELNSTVNITVTEKGQLIGEYHTAVTSGGGPGVTFPLMGLTSPGESYRTFGFTVNWHYFKSTTSWTGQCYTDCTGEQEVLITTWILTSEKSTCGDDWEANLVGKDVFTRYKPGTTQTPS